MSRSDETLHYSAASKVQIPVSGFIDSVVKLDLATKKQIDRILAEMPAASQSDTEEVAKTLRNHKLLSTLQAKNIADGKADYLKIGEDYVLVELLGKGGWGKSSRQSTRPWPAKWRSNSWPCRLQKIQTHWLDFNVKFARRPN